jgi:hypothetical protein
MLNKVYYDGDASKIIGERLILELIQDKLIEVRNNKLCVKAHANKGTVRIKGYMFAHEIIEYYVCPENVWISRLSEKYMAIDNEEDTPAKVYYDGDASIIEDNPTILELIKEKKIKIVDNKLLFHALYNKGTTRTSSPIYVLGGQWHDSMYKKAFEGSWIHVDDKGVLRIDYDNEALEKLLYNKKEVD